MTVIVALGGGMGHARRAFNLAERLDGTPVVLHQAPGDWPQPGLGALTRPALWERLGPLLERADRVVVDTFPGGVAHELLPLLDMPIHKVLVARYVERSAYADYDALAARYDAVWLPYTAAQCEWESPPAGEWIGPVTRALAVIGEAEVVVVGRDEPPSWSPLLQNAVRIDGPFDTLPRAKRYVGLAAGYNLGWELASLGAPVALRPLSRRFDDQFRRANALGVPLLHRRDLEAFLEGEC